MKTNTVSCLRVFYLGSGGVKGIPPNSLIQTTHRLSDFVEPVYNKLREEVVSTQVLHADETPHRMLEGSPRKNWYLWGFSSSLSTFFEIQESRSGSVASSILDKSSCRYLMSDVYSGYIKAVKDGNKYREEQGLLGLPQKTGHCFKQHGGYAHYNPMDSNIQGMNVGVLYYTKFQYTQKSPSWHPPGL